MAKSFTKILFCLFLLISISFAQEPNPIQKFANTLIVAKTDKEIADLLNQQKELVTIELRKELIAQGNQLRVRSDFPSALSAFSLAKKVSELIHDESGIAEALFEIANINRTQGDIGLALENTKKCLEIANNSGDKLLIARSLLYIGIFYRFQGDNDQALINTNKALEFADHLSEKELALAWNNIGVVYVQQGNFINALKFLEKALKTREKLADKDAIAGSLNNIAVAYDRQGSIEEALEFYKKSLKIREELGDKANIANVMNNMGDVRLLGSFKLALEYNKKSYALAEEIGDKPLMARAVGNIGNAYLGIGDFDHALEYSNKGLTLAQEVGDKEVIANELAHIAHTYFGRREYEKSLNYAQRSTAIAREIGGRQQLWTALAAEGDCYRKLNTPDAARKSYEDSIATIEDWRSLVAGGELEQQSLFSEKLSAYHGMIELLIEQNQIADALMYAEKAKARTLLDVLHSGKVDIAKEMSPKERLEESGWNQKLVSLNRDLENEKLSVNPDKKEIALLDDQLRTTRLDYESFRSRLYSSHPELRVRRGEIDPIQPDKAGLLIPGQKTVILEYVVTDTNTYLFALTKAENSSSIKQSLYTIKISEDNLAERIQSFRKQISNHDANFAKAAQALYALLIQPAQKDLDKKDRLILVPDDVLWELPFQTLQSPQNHFLLEDCSISLVPSCTVLREMKTFHKPHHESTGSSLLAFGNPTLSNKKSGNVNPVYRSAGLQPLPEAEKEVKTLAKIYGAQQSKIYVESQAREDYFKTEADQFQILHLATHGILNDASPMYSYVALTPDDSETEDGMLEAREIMNLKLKADLVVLSACDTALGRVGKGEGMIGLSWALFVAGTPSTLVSQWKVHSASTTELMLAFHRNLRTGETKAEALRSAALKLSKSPLYNHPFYWAPFVLIGDGF